MLINFDKLMSNDKCLLSVDGGNSGQLIFAGKEFATKKQMKMIKAYDEVSMMFYGEHLVKNYKDLSVQKKIGVA